MASATDSQALSQIKAKLGDQIWRLNHLYCITNTAGQRVQFKLNSAQLQLLKEMWYQNVILKARQLGMTTFIQIFILDRCIFNSNVRAGVIAHNKEDAQVFFRDKIKFAYDNLPEWLKAERKAIKNDAGELLLNNNSSIRVGTSMRSGTLQYLHVCLSGDTEVLLKDGVARRIRDVVPGDLVMNDRGSYQAVKMLVKNRIEDVGHPLLSLKTYGYYDALKVTGNHSVLTREHATGKPVWKQAIEIVAGDYIAFPVRETSMKLRDGCLPFGASKYAYGADGKRIANTGRRIKVDEALGFLMGFYLAEGSIRRTETTFAIHRDEVEMLVERLHKFSEYFSSIRVYHHQDSLTSTVTVNGGEFAKFVATYFGAGAEKRIPDAVWGYGRKFLDGLVFGYFSGDGCFTSDNQVQVTSIRRNLIDQMRMILQTLRFGVPAIYHRKAGKYYGRECKEVWVLKLQGAANWKFRKHFGLPLPAVNTWSGKWRVEHDRNPEGRKLWRRGASHYWARVTDVEQIADEEFVYDIALENSPHNYVTVNGVVHNSEYGKICRKYPEKAAEIRTGALNAVHAGHFVFVESTAEGRAGEFYELCQRAKKLQESGKAPTQMDYKFHFFPWWQDSRYRLKTDGVIIEAKMLDYFATLRAKHGITLDAEQMAWYVKKAAEQGEAMKQEFPSTPEESFEVAIDGAFYGVQMTYLRNQGRIREVPWEPALPVNTFWDLGMNDAMTIWFHQRVGLENRLIDCYTNSGEGLNHYAKVLKDKGYLYAQHYMPHDIAVRELGNNGISRKEAAENLGIKPIIKVNRPKNMEEVLDGIESVRVFLNTCWIDDVSCAEGIRALDNYQKEWDDNAGTWKKGPLHNWAGHFADALRTGATGFTHHQIVPESSLYPECV